jgi:hypothetical protein
MIVVLGEEAVQSTNVRAEWSYFLDRRKPIFPVLTEPCEIPYRLRLFQTLDFHQGMEAIPNLIEAIWDVLNTLKPPQDEDRAPDVLPNKDED